MSSRFTTPQDAEDAYYDAIDEKDIEAMMVVWEESDETLCLLPMMPAQQGKAAIRQAWEPLLGSGMQLDMTVRHLSWIESGDIAIHLIEEQVQAPGQAGGQAVYATNIYRRGIDGWHILVHQNSPTPPPNLQMPEIG